MVPSVPESLSGTALEIGRSPLKRTVHGSRIYIIEEVISMMEDTIEDLLTTSASMWSDESAASSQSSVQILSQDS